MKPTVCKCCGETFVCGSAVESQKPNICPSCTSLVGDVQDNMILESAIPLELDPAAQTDPQSPQSDPQETPSPALSKPARPRANPA